jgi:hypothetical protein
MQALFRAQTSVRTQRARRSMSKENRFLPEILARKSMVKKSIFLILHAVLHTKHVHKKIIVILSMLQYVFEFAVRLTESLRTTTILEKATLM